MSWSNTFIQLDKTIHDRTSFDCGEKELNAFIHTHAAKHMAAGISTTMVLPAFDPLPNSKYPICSFYAITPSSIERDTFPEALARKLPHYPVPVFLLAQLAVHSNYQGKGLGKITLIKALQHLMKINEHLRGYAVIVDCLNDDAKNFYLKYGFQILCEHNGRVRMFLPMKTIKLLFK